MQLLDQLKHSAKTPWGANLVGWQCWEEEMVFLDWSSTVRAAALALLSE